MIDKHVIALLLALSSTAVSAQTVESFSSQEAIYSGALKAVKSAVARRFTALQPNSVAQLALPSNTGQLFPEWGPPPRESAFDLTFIAETADLLTVCAQTVVKDKGQHAQVLRSAHKQKFLVSKTNCDGSPLQESGFPRKVVVRKSMSRQDVILPEKIIGELELTGIARNQVTKPAAVLQAYSGGFSSPLVITVTNPSSALYRFDTSLIREGFVISTNCTYIWPGESCTVDVAYHNQGEREKVAAIRLGFSQHTESMPALIVARGEGTITGEILASLSYTEGPKALLSVHGQKTASP